MDPTTLIAMMLLIRQRGGDMDRLEGLLPLLLLLAGGQGLSSTVAPSGANPPATLPVGGAIPAGPPPMNNMMMLLLALMTLGGDAMPSILRSARRGSDDESRPSRKRGSTASE